MSRRGRAPERNAAVRRREWRAAARSRTSRRPAGGSRAGLVRQATAALAVAAVVGAFLGVFLGARGALAADDPTAASAGRAGVAPGSSTAVARVARPLIVDLGGDEAATAVTGDARGRVLVAGTSETAGRRDVVLTAVSSAGAVDTAFGTRGTVRIDAGRGAQVDALLALGDAIVAVGRAGADATGALALRVTADGALDESFARRAGAALHAAAGARAFAVADGGVGGMLLIGGALREGDTWRPFVTRLRHDGAVDASFGERGRTLLPPAGPDAAVRALARDEHGRIVVAGGGDGDGFVARLAPDGALDPSFARGGLARVALDGGARVVAAASLADGGEVLVARPSRGGGPSVVARTRADGVRDERFGTRGLVTLEVAGRALQARSIALDAASGGIVIGGSVVDADRERTVLLRLAAGGTRDASFAVDDPLDAGGAPPVDAAAAVALLDDGALIGAGAAGAGSARDLALLRVAAPAATCGDGVVVASESCDDGAANGGTGSCCSTTCTLRPAGTACRPAVGACDEAELCDGQGARCPDDLLARAGAPCRAAAGACDVAEQCSGTSPECPANDVRPSGTICRLADGDCDLDEKCDGASSECPADAKRVGECRASRGACDPAEWCDPSGMCPADLRLPDGAACDDGDACTADDVCVAEVCRGGARDDFACTGYLCAQMRERERLAGDTPPAAALRALGMDVQQLEPRAAALCVPALTSGDDAGAATPQADPEVADTRDGRTSYVAYRVKKVMPARNPARPPRLASATIEDRFGLVDVAPGRVTMISLPAEVGEVEQGVHAGGVAYQCQHLARADATARATREVEVRAIGDASAERFVVERPVRVCHAADASAAIDAADDPDALLCYDLRPLGAEAATLAATPLLVESRFERLLVAKLGKRQLCVPASLLNPQWDEPRPRRTPPRDREVKRPRRPHRADREPRPRRPPRPPAGQAPPAAP